ncbi:hypothetical protein ACT21L_000090 [Vibrio vulnificus]
MKTSVNFEHLRKDWPELAELGAFAEAYAVTILKARWLSFVATSKKSLIIFTESYVYLFCRMRRFTTS